MPTSTEPQLRHARLLKIGVPVVTVLVMLLLLEGFLRFMPVASAARSAAVNQDNPVFHFTPNRTFVHSMGWDMHNVVRGRINNEGFFNDQDYVRDDPKPLISTFYAPVHVADHAHLDDIYCVICDADLNRVWVASNTESTCTVVRNQARRGTRLQVRNRPSPAPSSSSSARASDPK